MTQIAPKRTKLVKMVSPVLALTGLVNLLLLLNLLLFSNTGLRSQTSISNETQQPSDSTSINESINKLPVFQLINSDTINLGPNDELVKDKYTAMGQPQIYDALHSFNYRRSDKFGGYINEKINAGLERVREKGYKSDIKKLYIQIDPLTLTVYWFAVVGPSRDRYSYIRIDSRGSAGGYLKAVEKQLPKMHELYPDLVPVKFLEFNQNVTTCYTWDGKPLSNYSGFVNIQQHFFKYRKRYDNQKKLKSESQLDLIFGEEIDTSSSSDSTFQNDILLENKDQIVKINPEKKEVVKKKSAATKKYKVKSGDTLSEIAEKHRTSVSKIKKINNLRSDNIQIGQILKIPN
jgi:LysM repeat protein